MSPGGRQVTNHPIVHLGSRASTRGWGQARQRSPREPEQRGSGADSCGRVTAAAERALCLARGGRRRWRSRGDPAVCLPALLGFLVFPARFSPFPPTLRASSSLSKAISFCRSQLRVGFHGSPENPPDTPTRFLVGDYHNGSIGTF